MKGYLAIVTSTLIWGSVGIFARLGGQPPLITVTYRVLFAVATMGLVLLLQRDRGKPTTQGGSWQQLRRLGARPLMLMCLSGIALATNWLLFFKAIDTTSLANAVLSNYVAPVLVALASPLLLGERLERRTLIATGLAFGGIFIMLYQPGGSLSSADATGIGLGLISAFFYAMITIIGRWLSDLDPARLVLIQTGVASLVLLPAVALTSGGLASLLIPAQSLAMLAVIGVVHTALALAFYFKGLQTVKVQHVGVLAYLDPVSTVLFAYLFLGEAPAKASLIGGMLVLVSTSLLLKRRPAPSS